jgi:hypothetical protein
MTELSKDTIYVDIDEEITGLIDKLRSSSGKVVALVLPKRATVLQSIVNMRLLKRAADETKKNLVLITAEAGLLPLAGAVGVHVAKTLQSKPEIPTPPTVDDGREETVDEETAELADDEPAASTVAPVAGLAAAAATAKGAEDMETIELDNDDEAPATAAAVPKKTISPKKKNPKLHVPNFERFRLLLVAGVVVLILLIIGLFLALSKLPKATINIQTNASNVNTNVNFDLSTTATDLDANSNTVPAKQVTEKKTYTGTATATGQQNNGSKATGQITMTAGSCSANVPDDVPAGTGVSDNSKTYITQADTTFTPTISHKTCTYVATQTTDITAQSAGASYNTSTSSDSFTVADRSDVSASGGASGGTDNIQTVVQQSDVDNATGKINTQSSTAKSDLQSQLQGDNLYAITTTFTPGTPVTSQSANVGDPASNVTVTETITYTEYGAREDDLKSLIDANIKSQVNTAQQGILDDGFSNASFATNGTNPLSLTMTTTAEVGPNIDTTTIKSQAAGKKTADIVTSVKSDSNVTGATVKFSPFWVTTAPKNTNRITVVVAKPTGSAN